MGNSDEEGDMEEELQDKTMDNFTKGDNFIDEEILEAG